MPKINNGGVSDQRVDEDYIAPPGVAPEVAIEQGMPDAGQATPKQAPDAPDTGERRDDLRERRDRQQDDKQDSKQDSKTQAGKPTKSAASAAGESSRGTTQQNKTSR
jgi:hypothetical protein